MKETRLKKNLALQILYEFAVLIVPLVTTPYISKVLGPTLIGENSYMVTICNYFTIFAMLGLNNFGSRTISRIKYNQEELDKSFSSIFYSHLLISIIVLLSYFLFLIFFSSDVKNLYYIGILYILSSLLDINWFFWGIEKFNITIIRNLIIKIVSIFFVFGFVRNQNDLWIYALILALSLFLSNLSLWFIVPKYARFVKVPLQMIFTNFKGLLILFIPVIAVSVYRYMDKLMLGLLSTKTEVGFYEQTEKLINMGVGLVTAIGTVMLPRCSALFSEGKDDSAIQLIRTSNFFSGFASIAISAGLISVSKSLANVYLGNGFESCASLITCLSITIPIMAYANVIRTHYLVPKNMDFAFLLSAILGAVTNVILNIILIPIYGALGAIFGTIGAEFVVLLVQIISVWHKLPILAMALEYLPFLFIGLIMILVNYFLFNSMSFSWKRLLFEILTGASVYLFLSLIFSLLFRKKYFKQLLKKRSLKN